MIRRSLFSYPLSVAVALTILAPHAFAASDGVQVHLNVDGCNNNGFCEAIIGETALSCPLDCSTPPPSGGGSSVYGSIPVQPEDFFYDIEVDAQFSQASVQWQSTVPTNTVLRWGSTPELLDGSARSVIAVKNHAALLAGLSPGMRYYFSIEAENANHIKQTSVLQTFVTPFIHATAPQNPSHFTTTALKDGITLSWKNPTDSEFSYVRLMRAPVRYPSSPFDGELLFEGDASTFFDATAMVGVREYYSLFARDRSGNFSSGTVATAVRSVDIAPPPVIAPPTIPVTVHLYPQFAVIQSGRELTFTDNTATVGNSSPLSIESTPGGLRGSEDAWITITGPEGTSIGSYLFTYDQKRETYRADIPLLPSGRYHFSMYGYADGVRVLIGEGTFVSADAPIPLPHDRITLVLPSLIRPLFEFLALIFILFVVLKARKRSKNAPRG